MSLKLCQQASTLFESFQAESVIILSSHFIVACQSVLFPCVYGQGWGWIPQCSFSLFPSSNNCWNFLSMDHSFPILFAIGLCHVMNFFIIILWNRREREREWEKERLCDAAFLCPLLLLEMYNYSRFYYS